MAELDIQESYGKKAYLKRYRKNLALVDRLKNKVRVLDERMMNITPTLSDMPRGGTPVTIADMLAEKVDLEERIKRLESKGHTIKSEILDRIDELDDPRYAEVLESFFIMGKDFDTIAEENNYTTRHVVRLYSEAIDRMSL